MSYQRMIQDLECAHHNIGAVMVRIGIQKLLDPDVTEREEQIADAVALLIRVQEQMRQVRRSKAG